MKKTLLLLAYLAFLINANAQQKPNTIIRANESQLEQIKKNYARETNFNAPKAILCNDTLHYPLLKEQEVGNGDFYTFEAWASDNEAISQAFYYTGSSMTALTVSGVQIYGRSAPSNTGPVTLYAAIFNVDVNMNPTGMPLQWGTIAITDTNFSMRTIMFNQPAMVTQNYAIVVAPQPSGPGDIFEFFVNDALPAQVTDENLSRFRSNYYPASAGNWVNMPTLTAAFTGGPYDFEAIMAPIVQYSINTDLTTSPNPSCDGVPVSFNNLTSPMFPIMHRMYNYQAFNSHFFAEPDSTFAWDIGLTPTTLFWGASIPPYTYTTGTYNLTLYTLGGLFNSCLDTRPYTHIVNPQDDASFTYPQNTICISGPNPTPSVVTPGGTFSATPGGLVINPSTGEINLSTSTLGTYTVTYMTSGVCSDVSSQSITLTSSPSANFTYPNTSVCANTSTYTPTFGAGASAGTFSASPAGLNINASTGVINIGASTPGTYTITNFIAASGSCPSATHSETLTINALPTISVNPSSPSVCSNSTTGVTLVASGANSYSWTPSTGLNTTAGATVTANPTSTITYTVAGTDANGCSNSQNVTVTVNNAPNVTFNLTVDSICLNASPITLSGGSPAGGSYSGTGVSGGQFNPSNAGTGMHSITYTYTDGNGCTNSATQNITVVSCVGIEESSIAKSLLIAPNPVKEQLMISFNNANSNNVQVNIISADGKLVYSENAAAAAQYVKYVDVTTFAKGLYFLQIISDEGMINNKIIVQ